MAETWHGNQRQLQWLFYNEYYFYVGSDRPLLEDLYGHVVEEAAHKWKDLAVQLLPYNTLSVLDIIEVDYCRDTVSCCKFVLKKWLQTAEDATWNELIRALRSPRVQLNYLAGELEQIMLGKCEIYRRV